MNTRVLYTVLWLTNAFILGFGMMHYRTVSITINTFAPAILLLFVVNVFLWALLRSNAKRGFLPYSLFVANLVASASLSGWLSFFTAFALDVFFYRRDVFSWNDADLMLFFTVTTFVPVCTGLLGYYDPKERIADTTG